MKLIPIEYQDGLIWMDKTSSVNKGEWGYIANNSALRCPHEDGFSNQVPKIVAQSTNLSLLNIPYVEIEEDATILLLDREDFRGFEKFEESDHGKSLIEEDYKAASAKKYTEEDLRNAFLSAREFNSLDGIVDIDVVLSFKGVDNSDLQAVFITFDDYIKSLQPKILSIEIEMEAYQDTINYHKDIWQNFERPVTYQKDRKTFLKIKSIEYDGNTY